ncbi:MAG: GntR family transcriptional regulator, partial [Brevibacterium sp.]|nr:GntR family transcriptional regulator [Brevibacterium sp.]
DIAWALRPVKGDQAVAHEQAASARIAAELRSRIIQGTLLPGARIRQEEIAEEFGVSRLPIREALHILESSGLVTLVASTGAWVSTLDLDECREIYLMRERLEPLLLSLAMPTHSTESFAKIEASAKLVEEATSRTEFLECDRDFHAALMAGPATIRLRGTVDHLWNLTHYYRRQLLGTSGSTRRQNILAEHRMILSAVIDRDIESAEAMMALHIRRTRKLVEGHTEIFTHSSAGGLRRSP